MALSCKINPDKLDCFHTSILIPWFKQEVISTRPWENWWINHQNWSIKIKILLLLEIAWTNTIFFCKVKLHERNKMLSRYKCSVQVRQQVDELNYFCQPVSRNLQYVFIDSKSYWCKKSKGYTVLFCDFISLQLKRFFFFKYF